MDTKVQNIELLGTIFDKYAIYLALSGESFGLRLICPNHHSYHTSLEQNLHFVFSNIATDCANVRLAWRFPQEQLVHQLGTSHPARTEK